MGSLHLLDPKGLLLLAGLAPLVLLYVLKVRRKRQIVSSTLLWTAARRDLLAKHPFRKLVPELPLLLEILAFAALALALARPSTHAGTLDGDHVAVVLDVSASMSTRVGGPSGLRTRLDQAKSAARNAVSELAPGADAMVLEAGRDARIVAAVDRDVPRLQEAIDGVHAQDVEGDVTSALALAVDRLRSLGGRKRIVLITDGALAHDEPLAVAGTPTDVVLVGDDADNTAITRIDVRSGIDAASHHERVQVFVLLTSYAAHAREAYVTLTLEGGTEALSSRRLSLRPGERLPVVLTFDPAPSDYGKGLVVQLAPADAEPVDDVAFGRVPGPVRMPVVVASDAKYSWTTRAVEADPNAELQRLTLTQLATVNVDPDALVIVEGACPTSLPGRDALIVAPDSGSCFGVPVGATVETPSVTSWDSSDPRLRFLTLDDVHISKSRTLTAHGAAGGLVRSKETTLVADASSPDRMRTILAFDPGESDWPLKASFVLFVRNVVELSRQHRDRGSSAFATTGEASRIAVPFGTSTVDVDGPGMPERTLPSKDGFVVLPPLDRAGLYRVRWSEPHIGSTVVAANLTSPRESDVHPKSLRVDNAPGGPAFERADRVVDTHSEIASWLGFLAALVLAFDVFWTTRLPRRRRAVGLP